jgi:DNA-binding MarR family transcriptional regulator
MRYPCQGTLQGSLIIWYGDLISFPDDMQYKPESLSRPPMIRLLKVASDLFVEELAQKLATVGLGDIRPGHGCVFGNIDPENGSRLTELAERANMTKQSVGEVTSDLEQLGYLERVADPDDGRAKIIRLTAQGHHAYRIGRQLIDEVEREWGERFGEDHIVALRDALEVVTARRLGSSAVGVDFGDGHGTNWRRPPTELR